MAKSIRHVVSGYEWKSQTHTFFGSGEPREYHGIKLKEEPGLKFKLSYDSRFFPTIGFDHLLLKSINSRESHYNVLKK